jgi:phosphatidyl-myo-inositol dimannoside synthase
MSRDPRPRVLIVTPDFPPARGGIQTLMGNLAEHLPDAAVRVVTLATAASRTTAPATEDRDAPQVRRVRLAANTPQVRIATLSLRALTEAVRWRPNAVLAGHVATYPAAAAIRRLTAAPVLLYVHAEEFRVWPRRTRRAVRGADAVIAVSRHTEEMALRLGAPRERLHRIPPGVKLPDPPCDPASRASETPTILTVARLSQLHKGHDVMLRALCLLRERIPTVRWIVIGDGALRARFEAEAERLGIGGAVRFLGSVSDDERDRWLRAAHVFAMPSRIPDRDGEGLGGEGFGIVYLEAAAHGLPVVAGAEGGALDAVLPDRSGLLVDPRDPAAVASALERLLADPSLAATMGREAYEWAARCSWPATARRVADVLHGLAARPPAPIGAVPEAAR